MAHQYLVLEHGSQNADGGRYHFAHDGFAFWALLFPLPWLLVKRLWLEAVLLVSVYFALSTMALDGEIMWMAALYTFNTVAALWIALDGRHWFIEKQLARGATLRAVIAADSREEAELRYALTPQTPSPDTIVNKPFVPVQSVQRPKANDVLFATPWGNN